MNKPKTGRWVLRESFLMDVSGLTTTDPTLEKVQGESNN